MASLTPLSTYSFWSEKAFLKLEPLKLDAIKLLFLLANLRETVEGGNVSRLVPW